jgi:TRAP-type C4-dicarboxylate transport system permease small subunit
VSSRHDAPPPDGAGLAPRAPLPRIERWSLAAAGACLVAMVVLIAAEVVARSVFHFSFEVVDELGGYLLVALSFLALAPSLAAGAFHSVNLVQRRLSAASRRVTALAFTLLSIAFAAVMTFTTARYVWRTFAQGDVAPTSLQTPLWIPQVTMVVGLFALLLALARRLVQRRRGTLDDTRSAR